MIDFTDKTATQSGTPLNRKNLMAIQGFQTKTTKFSSDGSIVESYQNGGEKTTKFNPDGSVTINFTNIKSVTEIIKFNSDGSVSEVLQ